MHLESARLLAPLHLKGEQGVIMKSVYRRGELAPYFLLSLWEGIIKKSISLDKDQEQVGFSGTLFSATLSLVCSSHLTEKIKKCSIEAS